MSTDTDLRARLRDLADDAPRAGLVGEELWHTGVRRQRLRRAGAVGASAIAVVLVVALTSVLRFPTEPPVTDGPAELGIPRMVVPPDPWSEPVAAPGPLAAVSSAILREPNGLFGSRERLQLFGVSAVDGVARFLDLPSYPLNIDPGQAAISPDGGLVAVPRWTGDAGAVAVRGWDVLDTETGELLRLRDPDMPSLVGIDAYEISFSGDGRYLLTNYSLTGSEESHDDSLVAWDVSTGERFVAEEAGHFWLPGTARGPEGVVWTRGRDVLTFDPATGERDEIVVAQQLVDAAFAPDGQTLAYIGHDGEKPNSRAPWRLHVRTPDGGIEQLDVGIEPGQVLGWRDETHMVVSRYGPTEARVVDISTGDWEPLDLTQDGDALMLPRYASDLLARPVADAVEQPDAGDPRLWMHPQVQWIAGAFLLGGLLLVWLVVRRRRGRA